MKGLTHFSGTMPRSMEFCGMGSHTLERCGEITACPLTSEYYGSTAVKCPDCAMKKTSHKRL
ncbi:hypothetical protein FHX37_4611 [Haloactinospora alba]|uniref:Uncharacterized protein n=1 Tax=Haloactinospora alba TaxID=405555 RepID=A0A543N2L7_9ACTN|nr:hypothetical protein FHX37_4611 [Haloactinospora alba]